MAIDPVSAIAVATTAYRGIVSAYRAGKQVESMSKDIGKWMGAIADVKQAHQEKKTSRFKNVEEQALDTYAALKKAEKMEMELKNFLIANYGFNAWNDLMRIQRDLRKERLEERRRRQRRLENIMEMLGLGFVTLLIAGMVAGLVAWMVWLKGGFR
tara:strand:+ start:1636 stop:2103 length:468 start_codon:yes stop_codon:yes gene_type:complete